MSSLIKNDYFQPNPLKALGSASLGTTPAARAVNSATPGPSKVVYRSTLMISSSNYIFLNSNIFFLDLVSDGTIVLSKGHSVGI